MPVKEKLKKVVSDYQLTCPEEYALVKEMIADKRGTIIDKFARLDKNSDTRALFEFSETLSQMILTALTDEDQKWFDSVEGGRWFAKTFPAFRLAKEI